MSIDLTTENIDIVLTNNQVVVVDFYATWCSPCLQILRILPRLEVDLDARVVIGKVDIDQQPALRLTHEVKKVPTFIFFKNGVEAYRFEGVLTLATIKGKVASLLAD